MPKFNSKKEWLNEAKRLRATGLSAQEVQNKLGSFQVGDSTYALHNKGDGITSVNLEGRRARGKRRNDALKAQDAKLLETLQIGGMSEAESQAVLKREKAGYTRIEDQARELNKVHGKNAFNAGHETAALEGGANYGRNARVEIGKSRIRPDGTKVRGNQSRGRLDETRDSIKPAMGIPRSGRGGEDTALINLLEKDNPGIMDLGLTPKDKQDIKRTSTNAEADDIIAARQQKIKDLQTPKPPKTTFLHSADPVTLAIRGVPEAIKGIKNNRVGAAVGGVSTSLADPEAIADALEGDFRGATENVVAGVTGGAALQNILGIMPPVVQSVAGKVLPVLAGGQLFSEGRDGSATQRIVNKAADFTPGLKADPQTDVGKRTGDFIANQFNNLRNLLIPKPSTGRWGAQRAQRAQQLQITK